MKTSFRLLAAVFVLIAINSVRATDFVSQILQAGTSLTITVPDDRFLLIQNFTQEGPASAVTIRGSVSVTDRTGFMTNDMFTATILDPTNTTPFEPINNAVIAGSSTVTVTAGDTNCLITYRKGED
jgi:hypothetical protein